MNRKVRDDDDWKNPGPSDTIKFDIWNDRHSVAAVFHNEDSSWVFKIRGEYNFKRAFHNEDLFGVGVT
jgi:hypothetical protein